MVQERGLSKEKHYGSPILESIEATHTNYHSCMRLILENICRCSYVALSTGCDVTEIHLIAYFQVGNNHSGLLFLTVKFPAALVSNHYRWPLTIKKDKSCHAPLNPQNRDMIELFWSGCAICRICDVLGSSDLLSAFGKSVDIAE